MVTVITKSFDQHNTTELYEIWRARFEVFVMEQQCFYLDPDMIDYDCWHLFVWGDDGHLCAYARSFIDRDNHDVWHVGRMLTTRRRAGIGTQVMLAAISLASEHHAKLIEIDAQTHAIGFYERLGFKVTSGEFDEAGIRHVKMELTLAAD